MPCISTPLSLIRFLLVGASLSEPHNDVMYGGCVCGWLDVYVCMYTCVCIRSADKVSQISPIYSSCIAPLLVTSPERFLLFLRVFCLHARWAFSSLLPGSLGLNG